ncbi:arginase-1-like [Lytechinus variegatus]|uniref:arginase-1-like n=1 Tax=Lytechinus variegatus TaxID=7654 RepID=UPI001BB2535C|nr:arginase-1-like [Lytechinus variegatus]
MALNITRCCSRAIPSWLRTSPGYHRSVRQTSMASRLQSIGVLGVPINKGQDKDGVVYGPTVLRDAGLISSIEELGHRVIDHGDLVFPAQDEETATVNYVKNAPFLGKALKKISKGVEDITKQDQLCVTLGGDHGITIGSLHGHTRSRPDLCVLWVDAHADINVPQTSPSGHLHGMVLSFVCHELRHYLPKLPNFDWLDSCISCKDIAYIGLRDVDVGERHILEKHGIQIFSIHDVQKYGVAEVFARAMDMINPRGTRPVHLSFDIDSLDPGVSASTGTPVLGGLTYREGIYIAEEIAQTDMLSSMDLVEVNPQLGSPSQQESTINAGVDVILAALGKRKEGNVPVGYEISIPWDDNERFVTQKSDEAERQRRERNVQR